MRSSIAAMMLCLVCLATPVARAEDTVTLAELKQQVPRNLVLDVTDPDGNTLHFDMPVVLPEGETLPVLRVKPVLFDASDPAGQYPVGKGVFDAKECGGWMYQDVPALVIVIKPQNGGAGRSTPQTSTESARYIMPDGQPAGNDMPATRPVEIIRENVARYSGRNDFDIRIFRQFAMSGLYHYQSVASADSAINLNKPRQGYEKGTWQLYPAQYLRGAEIFYGGFYRPTATLDFFRTESFWPDQAGGRMFALDEDDYRMIMRLLEETEVVLDDAPLAPFAVIQSVIAQRALSGQLKSGYKLTLGYNICCRSGDPNQIYEDYDPAAVRFTLVPTWRIDGYDTKDAVQFKNREVTREALEGPEDYRYDLRLDARTGEVLRDYHTDL